MNYKSLIKTVEGRLEELKDGIARLYLQHQDLIRPMILSFTMTALISSCNSNFLRNSIPGADYNYIPGTIRW